MLWGFLVRGRVPQLQKVVVMSKWYLDPKVSVRVTFRYNRMTPEAFEAAQEFVCNPLTLGDVKGLVEEVEVLGYDVFDVAWLNLWWTNPNEEPSNCYYSLVRSVDPQNPEVKQMRVVKKEKEVVNELML